MKSTLKALLIATPSALSLLAVLAMPVRLAAQQEPAPVHYHVVDLGTLTGGNFSQPFYMNSHGVVSGSSNLPDNTQHAVLWFGQRITDLGTLGGPNSFAFAVNSAGRSVGEAETSISDPNGEDFCGFGTHLICGQAPE